MVSNAPPDPYQVLGVAVDAQLPEIRSAHRRLVLKCHPDRFLDPTMKENKKLEFQRVQQAYELISDDKRRSAYDEQVKLVQLRREKTKEKPTPRPSAVRSPLDTPIPSQRVPHPSVSSATIPEIPRQGPYRRPQGIQVAKGDMNGIEINAIPDTGAEFNIIAATFAERLGLELQDTEPDHCRLLRMANGKHIKTIGIVQATWTFLSDSSQSWSIILHVLSDFIYDVILGSHFLFSTQTLSHNQQRLSRIPRPLQSFSVLRVNLLGSVNRFLSGSLLQQPVHALPDSGSEPSLLSYEYAEQRGWLLTMDLEDQNLLQFADGSLATTSGSIHARWLFLGKKGSKRVSQNVHFHILRGCPHRVILGQDVLDETDAFLQHEDCFVEIISETDASGLNLVIWASKKKKASTSSELRHAPTPRIDPSWAEHDELQKRAAADRRIGRLGDSIAKTAALAEETMRRQDYDTRMESQSRTSTLDSGSTRTSSTSGSRATPTTPTNNILPRRLARGEELPNRRYQIDFAARFDSAEVADEHEFNSGRLAGRRRRATSTV